MHRRELLKLLGASAALPAALATLPAAASAALPVVPALFARRLGAIGIQLYTVRSLMEHDVDGTLAALASIGYREVELAGLYKHSATQMRASLDRAGLAAPSGHIGLAEIRTSWQRTLDEAAALGHRYIVCAWIDEKERSLRGYERIAEELDRAGETSKKHGIQLAYHNHDFEFKPVERQVPYDLLLAKTDPSLVHFEMDIFWLVKGGRDPLHYFAERPERFPLVHVKDMSKSGEMVDVGRGTIDFARIFAAAGDRIKHYFVEHDEPPSPIADARVCYEYLRNLTF